MRNCHGHINAPFFSCTGVEQRLGIFFFFYLNKVLLDFTVLTGQLIQKVRVKPMAAEKKPQAYMDSQSLSKILNIFMAVGMQFTLCLW